MYIIYGHDNCSWCDAAKRLVLSKYIIFKNIMKDELHFRDFKNDFPDAKTVPKIIEIDDYGNRIQKFESYTEFKDYINPTFSI